VLFPVRDAALRRHLRDVVLETYLRDDRRARRMRRDGSYERLAPPPGASGLDSQLVLLDPASAGPGPSTAAP
jgi:hypothetical protein